MTEVVVGLLAVGVVALGWRVWVLERDVTQQAERIRGYSRDDTDAVSALSNEVAELIEICRVQNQIGAGHEVTLTELAGRVEDLERRPSSDVTPQLLELLGRVVAPTPTAPTPDQPETVDPGGAGIIHTDESDWSDAYVPRPEGAVPPLPEELRGG